MNVDRGTVARIAVATLDRDGAGVGTLGSDDARAQPSESGNRRREVKVNGNLEVHVPGALPGDVISAQIEHVSTHAPRAWARLREVHHPSPHRVAATCRAHGRCGGCVLQHFDYRAQVAWKESTLRSLVAEHPVVARVVVAPAVPSPLVVGYRNKSKLVPGRDETGRLVLGAYAPRSHDVVDLAGCTVAESPLDEVAAVLRDILEDQGVEPYDERRKQGSLRYVVLRANSQQQVLVTLVTASDAFAPGVDLAARLGDIRPEVAGVVHNVNQTHGNAIYGPTERLLAGAAHIEDEIGGVRLQISSRAFFQANRLVARAAYEAIAGAVALTGHERVVDAYAGVGGIALTLARRAGPTIGIEEHPSAVADADASARLSSITNARFIAGDAGEQLARLDGADVVVLNPPRRGCQAAVLERAAALRPRVIAYLSCAPETLLRDLAILAGLGYRTTEITPFDMLPHTPHLEALAVLAR